jgi:hypothetical protein
MTHLFDHQKRSLAHSRRLIACGTAFLVVLMIASAGIALMHLSKGKAAEAAGSRKRTIAAPHATATPSSSPISTSTPPPAVVPVSKAWYFPEGKVGQGFTEYLTIENPDAANDCNVTLYYIGSSGSPVTKSVTVPRASRFTEPVNADLNTPASSTSYQTVSAVVTVNTTISLNCAGVVAERPIYFTNFLGISSGTDVLGATHLATTFYFADVPIGGSYVSYVTILNPGSATATATAVFSAGGKTVAKQIIQIPAMTRGTIVPKSSSGALQHAALFVTTNSPVAVERPTYFNQVSAGNAQTVSGAASVVAASALQTDWLFAEGYTGPGFQEYLVLANFSPNAPVKANVILEFNNGHTETIPSIIAPQSQAFLDVNAALTKGLGTCDTTPCQPTPQVSAEVKGNGNFIAQREMFFHYNHTINGISLTASGGSDVIGASASAVSAYSFAEGYTNQGYNEWLTMQNPTANTETITCTVINEEGRAFTQTVSLVAHSRFTIDVTALVLQHLIQPNDTVAGYEVSMTVQSSGGSFLAERPMYWNTGPEGTQGGSDVIGYNGN